MWLKRKTWKKEIKKNGPETIVVFVRSNDIHFRLIYSILKHLHFAQKRMCSFVIRRKSDAFCAFPSAVNLRTLSIVWCVFNAISDRFSKQNHILCWRRRQQQRRRQWRSNMKSECSSLLIKCIICRNPESNFTISSHMKVRNRPHFRFAPVRPNELPQIY